MCHMSNLLRVTICAIFPGHVLSRISILPKIFWFWLCLHVQTDRCVTSVPYVFEMLSRYFESKQYRNSAQDAPRKNVTHGDTNLLELLFTLIVLVARQV